MRNMFYGWEVQSFGVTISWTLQRKEAEDALNKASGSAVLFKHNGETKTKVLWK